MPFRQADLWLDYFAFGKAYFVKLDNACFFHPFQSRTRFPYFQRPRAMQLTPYVADTKLKNRAIGINSTLLSSVSSCIPLS